MVKAMRRYRYPASEWCMCMYVSSGQRGAIFLEFVLVFPIMLVILFILLFLGTGYNARASLNSAVATARLAYTRGQNDLMGGVDLIPEVVSGSVHDLDPFLTSSGLEYELDAGGYYSDMVQTESGDPTLTFRNFALWTPYYVYSHIYAIQAMKQSVGPTLKYPCDNAPGCMACRNLLVDAEGDSYGTVNYNPGFVSFECTYRLDNSLLNPIDSLIRLITGNPQSTLMQFTAKYEGRF